MTDWNEQRLKARTAKLEWPNHRFSRRMDAGGIGFHVQDFGDREAALTLVMLHGTAASTHSFAPLVESLLASGLKARIILVDLPGHGFTDAPPGFQPTLPAMAASVTALLDSLGVTGASGIGHSAGAAILLEIAAARPGLLRRIIALNAALEPMRGHALLSPLAKGLFLNPLTPHMFAWRARYGGMTRIMLRATGSSLDETALARYQFLLEDAAHVRGALAMMANWDLQPLQDALPGIEIPVTLIAAQDDAFVPARVSAQAAARLPAATLREVALGGHLVHETDPELIADMVIEALADPITGRAQPNQAEKAGPG